MKNKRFLCLLTVAVAALCMAFSVSADNGGEKFWANQDKLTTDTNAPTISFDTSAYKDYVKNTKDASLIDLSIDQEKDNSYQGASLKISASLQKELKEFCTYSDEIRDDDGKLIYPDAAKKDAGYVTMGVKISAGDLGANIFDGCMITFKYRIAAEADGKLLNNSVYVFPTNDKYEKICNKPVELKMNTSDSNNVDQYAQGVVTVPEGIDATELVFEVPVIKPMEKSDVLFIDNIVVTTPLKSGSDYQQLANVDGYNSNAKIQEAPEGLKIKEKENTYSSVDDPEEGSKISVGFIIGIAAAAAVAVGLIIFAVRKYKNRFY